jgi:hypothetical protein
MGAFSNKPFFHFVICAMDGCHLLPPHSNHRNSRWALILMGNTLLFYNHYSSFLFVLVGPPGIEPGTYRL